MSESAPVRTALTTLLEGSPSRCGPRLSPAVGRCGYVVHGRGEKGAGRSPGTGGGRRRRQWPAHARLLPEAWDAEGARAPMRAGTLVLAEASPPALAVRAAQARARVISGRPE